MQETVQSTGLTEGNKNVSFCVPRCREEQAGRGSKMLNHSMLLPSSTENPCTVKYSKSGFYLHALPAAGADNVNSLGTARLEERCFIYRGFISVAHLETNI